MKPLSHRMAPSGLGISPAAGDFRKCHDEVLMTISEAGVRHGFL